MAVPLAVNNFFIALNNATSNTESSDHLFQLVIEGEYLEERIDEEGFRQSASFLIECNLPCQRLWNINFVSAVSFISQDLSVEVYGIATLANPKRPYQHARMYFPCLSPGEILKTLEKMASQTTFQYSRTAEGYPGNLHVCHDDDHDAIPEEEVNNLKFQKPASQLAIPQDTSENTPRESEMMVMPVGQEPSSTCDKVLMKKKWSLRSFLGSCTGFEEKKK